MTIDLQCFKDMARVIFTPSCWVTIHRFSQEWDDALNEMMRDHEFRHVEYAFLGEVSEHEVSLGGYLIWVSNHPYASFAPGTRGIRPSRRTMLKAGDKLERECGWPNKTPQLKTVRSSGMRVV